MRAKPVQILQLISSLEVGGSEKLLLSLLEESRMEEQRLLDFGQTEAVQYTIVVINQGVNPDMRAHLQTLDYPVYYLNRPQGHLHITYLQRLLRIIRRHDIDVIHAHNIGSKLWATLCKLVMPRLKLVVTVHDTGIVPAMSPAHQWIHRHMVTMNIPISKAVEAECLQAGIRNCRQVYNGIPISRFSQPGQRNFSRRPLRIIQVARMDHRKKGQDILLKALRLCLDEGLDVHCRLVGGVYSYNQASYEYLQQLVEELDLSAHVEFVVNRHDIPELLREAELFVLSSRFEGLGLVVMEAMAAGLPVIASNIDGPRELIADGRNGFLFHCGDAEDLANKIKAVYTQVELAERVRQEAAQSVRHYDISAMVTQYVRIYESLLAGRKSVVSGRQLEAN